MEYCVLRVAPYIHIWYFVNKQLQHDYYAHLFSMVYIFAELFIVSVYKKG